MAREWASSSAWGWSVDGPSAVVVAKEADNGPSAGMEGGNKKDPDHVGSEFEWAGVYKGGFPIKSPFLPPP